MLEAIDEREYLTYLYELIGFPLEISDSYYELCKYLLYLDFYAKNDRDINRVYDANVMRNTYLSIYTQGQHYPKYEKICSVLEIILIMARLSQSVCEDDIPNNTTYRWFRELTTNLGLGDYTDDYVMENDDLPFDDIDYKINTFVEREYYPSGVDGMFPLRCYEKDQRKVELWYQMHAYLMENYIKLQ